MSVCKALLLEGIDDAAAEALIAAGIEVESRPGSLSSEDLNQALQSVSVLGIRSKTKVNAEVIAQHPDLLAIGCFCIGTDQVASKEAGRSGVAVFNSPFSNTRSVAELTIAEIIVLHRKLFDRSRDLHAGHWLKSAKGAHEIRGRTLGLVGYGHIGSQLSVLGEAMGMRVIYHDIASKMALGNARSLPTLDALLSESDVVSLHVPDTPQTRGLIGERELGLMRDGAMLINNARGTVVDLEALASALSSGKLAGAAVDVFQSEPTHNDEPFSTPLAGIPNVILTPHIGGSTREAQKAIAQDTAEKLRRYIKEGSTLHSVSVPQVDLPSLRPNQSRILHFHRNIPGVLGRMHTMLADIGVNINAEYLQSDPETSYVILDVDTGHDKAVKAGLHSIEETIRLRTLF
jgi:D-3-phosphoglycerate dehydrogenase